MKLLRYGAPGQGKPGQEKPGQEKPGILAADGDIRDLSGIIPDIAGEALVPESIEKLRKVDLSRLPIVRGRPRIGTWRWGSARREFVTALA